MTIEFIFLHGDSEYALKGFGLVGGVLMACERQLRARAAETQKAKAEELAQAQSEPEITPPRVAVPVSW